jgi:tetratricopeptide (TPR) repeat protein
MGGRAETAQGITDADNYIAQGKYNEAMNVYKKLLSRNPGDNVVRQRVEELRSLLKLLGKDKEELITTLDNFLAAIKKRRNEFYRSA